MIVNNVNETVQVSKKFNSWSACLQTKHQVRGKKHYLSILYRCVWNPLYI